MAFTAKDLGKIKEQKRDQLLKIAGVEGIGIGDDELIVYLSSRSGDAKKKVDDLLSGVPYSCTFTGEIKAQSGPDNT